MGSAVPTHRDCRCLRMPPDIISPPVLARTSPRGLKGFFSPLIYQKEVVMDAVHEQLTKSKVIAVVGLSPNTERDSHRVAKYMQEQGYRIIPVNPMVDEVLGKRSYPDLKSVPESIDMVDIFRRSETVPPVVDEAIAIGAKYIWMQDGVVNEEAANKAEDAGISVIMDN